VSPLSQLRHELLTPINHLSGYSEILVEELGDLGERGLLPHVAAIQAASRDALLFVQQALPKAADIGECNLATLRTLLPGAVESILDSVSQLESAAEPGVRTHIEGDIERIRNAARRLRELAENGASAEPPKSTPRTGEATEPVGDGRGRILVVDDNEANRDLLCRQLRREGYSVAQAGDGLEALDLLDHSPFDLVLLDVMMPRLDGIQTLTRLRETGRVPGLSVVMISALDEVSSVVACMELGAEDFLPKPFDPVLLRARIGNSLERKRLRDEAEALLNNVLPPRIADELRRTRAVAPKYYDDVSIVFTDFAGFTLSTESMAAEEIVEMLDQYFTLFDGIVSRYGLEKLKTIGDSYMYMGGMPPRSPSHPVDSLLAAMEMARAVEDVARSNPAGWQIRIGMHTGPVVAGVVGRQKFAFDVWGDTVNYSSRMESSGAPGRINISDRAYARVKDFFECEPRGKVQTKDQRSLEMYFIKGIHPKLAAVPQGFARRYRTYFERDLPAFPEFL
jgi:DNA-binding response OmpR family regulator